MITSPVAGGGSINSVEHELDDPGGGTADDDPGGGSITSADADSALIVSNASKDFLVASTFLFCDWIDFVS